MITDIFKTTNLSVVKSFSPWWNALFQRSWHIAEGQSIIQGSGHLFNRNQMPSNYLITKHPNLVLQQKSFKQSLIISQNTLRLYDHFSRFSSVQSLSCVRLFSIPWIAALQASLSITNSWGLLKLMSIESVMPSSHLILCRPFSSCPQSLPASGSFPVSQLFAWGGQSIGVSASASDHFSKVMQILLISDLY